MDLGSLFITVRMETVTFERSAVTVESRMKGIVRTFEQAASGAASFDRSMVTASTSANKLSASTDRAQASVARQAAAEEKAAAAAQRHSAAETRVAEVMASVAGESAKLQAATLRQVAAQERLSTVQASGTATTRELAAAQAGLISAQRSVAAAQTTMATKAAAAGSVISKKFTLPVVAAAAVSIDQAVKFQKATNVYVTAAGESQKNLETVRSGIKGVATETGTSIDQLTAAEYLLEKAGLRGAGGIKLLDASAKGASEENANLADVVQGATSVMASYHLSTDKSVQVINALKTGAGQAKVTMEEYVKSLSTVIPIASAAGISIGQVLGAVSTLTQHGTTAAEATQELANTVRNLQAPNNVAVAAMNQLGISSVNVSKNLGKRGLTGTFDYIASQLPKTGLVYLDTMKHMESGTSDLTAMQAKMPPQLAKLSDGFLKGTVNAADYRKAFRGMSADGYAQGSAFLSLAGKVKGYSDNIKNGTPAQKTMAAELKAIYGGATGLNTVLQLGGNNLAGFQARTKAVNASLHDGSKDVEGWASTAKLASTQAGIAKEKLHVLAIDAGSYLLPAFNKLVSGGSKVVTWIGNLSHTDKEILGWSVGILAALGPILAIVGRLSKVFTLLFGLGKGMVKFASTVVGSFGVTGAAAELAALQVTEAEATQAAAAAESAAAVARSEATKAASTAEASVSIAASVEGTSSVLAAEATAAAEAAIEFAAAMEAEATAAEAAAVEIAASATAAADAVAAASAETDVASSAAFGPVGLAIGAVVGVGALAAHALGLFGSTAKAQVKPTQALTDAILADNDALGENVRKLEEKSIESKGLYDAGLKLGINQKTLTDAVMGNKSAIAQVNAVEQAGAISGGKYAEAATKLRDGIGGLTTELKVNKKAADNVNAANSVAGKNDTARAKAIKAAAKLNDDVTASLKTMNVQVAENGVALEGQGKHAVSNRASLTGMITAADKYAKAQLNSGSSIDTVTNKLGTNILAFEAQALQAGFTEKDIDKLIKTYRLTPKQLVTNMVAHITSATASAKQLQKTIDSVKQGKVPGLTANSAQGRAVIAAIQTRIDKLKQGTPPTIDVDTSAAMRKLNALLAKIPKGTYTAPAGTVSGGGPHGDGSAAGSRSWTRDGKLPPGLSTVGERGWELVRTDSAGRSEVVSHGASMAATGLPDVLPGFASGTSGNEAKIAAGLSSGLGVGRAGLAGILGNLEIESHFNPLAHNAKENAWGIAQWEGSRLTSLRNYADKHHESYKSLNAQIGYLVQELRGSSVLKQIKGMSNPAQIAAQVDAQFERSSGSTRGERMSAATSIAGQLKSGGLSSSGGGVGEITTTTVGGKKKWVYGGIQYASQSAAENAQTRDSSSSAKDRADAAKSKVSAAIGHIGQAGAGNPIDLSTVSYTRVAAQIKAAQATLHKEIGAGLSKGAEKSAKAQIANLRKDATAALHNLRVKIKDSDVSAIRTALSGTASDLRAAFSTLLSDTAHSGASSSVISLLRSSETQLLANQKALASATTTLNAMKDYRSGIQSTLTGSFDSTGFGSIADLQAGFSGATGTNTAYAAELTKLRGEAAHAGKGGKTDTTLLGYINQLAASGQTTTLQTLAGTNMAGLRQASASIGAYNTSVTKGGDAAVVLKYGKSQAAEQAIVTADQKNQKQLLGSLATVAASMARLAAHPPKSKLDKHGLVTTIIDPAIAKALEQAIHTLDNHATYGHK